MWVSDTDRCNIVCFVLFFIVLTVLEINELQQDYKVQDYKVFVLVICPPYNYICKFVPP